MKALLIVHMQKDIVEADGAFGQLFAGEVERRQVVAEVTRCAAEMREIGGLVVWLRIAFDGDYQANMPLLQAAESMACLAEGSPGAQLVLPVAPGDKVVTHRRPGPFTDSELASLLRERQVTDVYVAGVATNASVEGCVRQAADLGFRTHVVEPACAAADADSHAASISTMTALFCCSAVRNVS